MSTVDWSEGIRTSLDDLPAVVATYLDAHRQHDVATAISTFTADAAVTDEGHTYRGREEIGTWLGRAASQYTFTTDFTGATTIGAAHVDVVAHLEGDFPGRVADLHFRFLLEGTSISRLVIEP
ncbi:nuclear transport factor 2 family protein [Mycobacterium deserti]|uniref:Nuclear transport factor 2 family protein n=1 Tax=Mycobacterium deserti TaxID=2978347 RepID=A0ABT2MHI1_9MYCO|nr:nuclear transport factor 2 family protein [Mycobacterium deserti]MCT7661451.1 nuclear transport factor 2 family protein [Mycobacterium deserti]